MRPGIPASPRQHVFLIGFMGAGKTTLGRLLAAKLEFPFYDMDECIVRRTGKPIAQIFAEDGEASFRKLETELLRDIIQREAGVVATGGGCFIAAENRELIRNAGISVWLDAPPELMLARGGRGVRPLWKSEDDARSLLERRLPHYQKADLHLRLNKDDNTSQTVERLTGLLPG